MRHAPIRPHEPPALHRFPHAPRMGVVPCGGNRGTVGGALPPVGVRHVGSPPYVHQLVQAADHVVVPRDDADALLGADIAPRLRHLQPAQRLLSGAQRRLVPSPPRALGAVAPLRNNWGPGLGTGTGTVGLETGSGTGNPSSAHPLKQPRRTLPAANAHRHDGVAAPAPTQLVQRRRGELGARATQRVAQGDGAAVHVELLVWDLEGAFARRWTWLAKASLSSTRSMSFIDRPVFARAASSPPEWVRSP